MGLVGQISRHSRRLGVRVAALLTIALLPLGLIAVVQTRQISEVAQQRAELTLLALTERSVTADRVLTQRALGSARALATVMPDLVGDNEACIARMRHFVADAGYYSLAAFVPVDGMMRCASNGATYDFSDWPGREERVANPQVSITLNLDAPLSGTSVLVVSHPSYDASGALIGFVSLSLPTSVVQSDVAPAAGMDLVIFASTGEVVSATGGDPEAIVPADTPLRALVASEPRVFAAPAADGTTRTFAVVPFAEGRLFAMGSYADAASLAFAQPDEFAVPAWVFPLLMWLVSLLVAYAAIHRLAIQHVKALASRMADFADRRALPSERFSTDAPLEIAEMEDSFATMARQIVEDEAHAENALHQQQILLREVHHRVKNNLQLISSIISIQMRELGNGEASFVLQRVQDRVLGLAAIHRNLYQATDIQQLPADSVVKEIVRQMMRIGVVSTEGIDLRTDIQTLQLYPDQAVPLCMFLTEALTNALKYIGAPDDGGLPWVAVSLTTDENGEVELRIENSIGDDRVTALPDPTIGTGLGRRLLAAFANQIGGRLEHGDLAGSHFVSLRFRHQDLVEETSPANHPPADVAAE
ncbi:MAG: sensor histidine kinase [Hasllibacter sp.]